MTPIELSTRRRVTGLTSDEFARLFVTVEREVDGENAQWDADDVESWEIIGPPATADQHLRDALGAANEFVATLADQIYRAVMPVDEAVGITAYSDNLTFWAEHPGLVVCRMRYGISPRCRRSNGSARRPVSSANWKPNNHWYESCSLGLGRSRSQLTKGSGYFRYTRIGSGYFRITRTLN